MRMSVKTARIIRIVGTLLFLLYVAGLVYFLFFSESYGRKSGDGMMHYNLVPFYEIRRFWENRRILGMRAVLANIGGNVLIFMPFGAILPVLFRKMRSCLLTVGLGALISLWIETLQLLTRVGSFDVDDILLNAIGALAGYLIFALCDMIRRRVL